MKAFWIVVVIGVFIGLAMPGRRPPAAPAATAGGPAVETKLEREANGHFYAHATVNGELVHFLVDTGATGVALTEADARRVGIQFSPGEFEIVGRGASGDVRGKLVTLDAVEIDGKKVQQVRGAVLEGADISLLGQSYLSRISSVQMSRDYMILR